MGAPVEFLKWSEVARRFGPDGIRDFAPAYGRIGAITDDTQMTMFTAEGLIRAERFGTIEQPINDSKGCGTVMRMTPVGLTASDPFRLGCDIAALTHDHPTGYVAAGFLALLIRPAMDGADLSTAAEAAVKELENYRDTVPSVWSVRCHPRSEGMHDQDPALDLRSDQVQIGPMLDAAQILSEFQSTRDRKSVV